MIPKVNKDKYDHVGIHSFSTFINLPEYLQLTAHSVLHTCSVFSVTWYSANVIKRLVTSRLLDSNDVQTDRHNRSEPSVYNTSEIKEVYPSAIDVLAELIDSRHTARCSVMAALLQDVIRA
jgi:hypothetical protein